MTFNAFKKSQQNENTITRAVQRELDRVPKQLSDYMNEQCNRFSEICKLYLEGMTLDDVKFMKPEDLINIVPQEQYKHKLLMSIMVRRYLYRCDDDNDNDNDHDNDDDHNIDDNNNDIYYDNKSVNNDVSEKKNKKNTNINNIQYLCDNCTHSCHMRSCSHKCSDYNKIIIRAK